MPTKLRKLKITRVAVCEQGANYDTETGVGAHILLFKHAAPVVTKEDAACDDASCTDPDCPTHGTAAKRKKKPVDKQGLMGQPHAEPDGDEMAPLDYATRAAQQDLWCCLWDKWDRFRDTFYDCVGDCDADNVPYLPTLVTSIGQFQADVQQLLEDCGVAKQVTPLLASLQSCCAEDLAKAGAALASHRRDRLHQIIAQLQQFLVECTPETVDRPGVSAAEVAGIPGVMKGDPAMADKASAVLEGNVAQTQIDALTKRATDAEAQVQVLTARVAELEPLVAKTAELEATIAKMAQTPEEQEAAYWASVPEPVRKKHEQDEAEKVELRKKLAEADERVEKADYIAKVAEFRPFGMVPDKHWTILKALQAMPEEDRTELVRLIKAAMAQQDTAALFSVRGYDSSEHTGTNGTGSASEQLMTLTKAYMKEHNTDFGTASEAVAKEHRELYAKSIQERRHATRTVNN